MFSLLEYIMNINRSSINTLSYPVNIGDKNKNLIYNYYNHQTCTQFN